MSGYTKPMKVHHRNKICGGGRSFYASTTEKESEITCRICLAKLSYERGNGYTLKMADTKDAEGILK